MSDAESKRHRSIVQEAVEGCPLDFLLAAFAQFGWQRQRVDADKPQVGDLERVVRTLFVDKLAQRVFGALEKWRTTNVWLPTQRYGRRYAAD